MAQDVRGDAFEQAALAAVAFYQHPEAHPLHRFSGAGEEDAIACAAAVEFFSGIAHVSLDRFDGGAPKGDDAFLHPLAEHAHAPDLKVDVAELQVAQL